MRLASHISTRLVSAGEATTIPKCEVLVDGTNTGCLVPGAVLEAAVCCGEGALLFLTDGVPFEEYLSIHLLDRDWDLLDTVVLGGLYSTGSFCLLRLIEPDTVSFRFIGDKDWSVTVLARPAPRLPFLSEPRGVKRAIGFSRHFIIRSSPRPCIGND